MISPFQKVASKLSRDAPALSSSAPGILRRRGKDEPCARAGTSTCPCQIAIQPFAERLRAFHRAANREGFADKLLSDLTATDNIAFDEFCHVSTAAFKDAPAAAGPFPVVIYHPGYAATFTAEIFLEALEETKIAA